MTYLDYCHLVIKDMSTCYNTYLHFITLASIHALLVLFILFLYLSILCLILFILSDLFPTCLKQTYKLYFPFITLYFTIYEFMTNINRSFLIIDIPLQHLLFRIHLQFRYMLLWLLLMKHLIYISIYMTIFFICYLYIC